jgi:hypothetical protein
MLLEEIIAEKAGFTTKFKAFRIGLQPKKLADRNVGAVQSTAERLFHQSNNFLKWQRLKKQYVTQYEITSYKPFGEYLGYIEGFTRTKGISSHKPNKDGLPIGYAKYKGWWSLPKDGAWDYKVIRSVRVPDLVDVWEEGTTVMVKTPVDEIEKRLKKMFR